MIIDFNRLLRTACFFCKIFLIENSRFLVSV
nr:MAG TPA: hypothetical protein [Caudoviricetes sp.]